SPYLGDWRLNAASPSKTASATGGEIGAYGNGGNVAVYNPGYSTTPTTSGSLTQNERWSGDVVLTGDVTVNWPWRLVIEPGTRIKVPANASLTVNSLASLVGSAESPIIFEAASGGGQWSGLTIGNSAAASVVRYVQITGANTCLNLSGTAHEINHNIINGCGTAIMVNSGGPKIE
ncbi:hypothetical protein, partial [Methylomonas koyamae]